MRLTPRFVTEIVPRVVFQDLAEFLKCYPKCAIALDGVIKSGPFFYEKCRVLNFDHHYGVVREATMSTAKQINMAIQLGLMDLFHPQRSVRVVINDIDQDTALALWQLKNSRYFKDPARLAAIEQLLRITDLWDITAGAFPLALDPRILRQHAWVFRAYTEFRISGQLARADATAMRKNLAITLKRITAWVEGQAQEVDLDERFEMVYRDSDCWYYRELGGNEARHYLWGQGMNAYVALGALRPDGRQTFAIGRRSRYYTQFPLPKIAEALSAAEEKKGLCAPWGVADIVGGSHRELGSGLSFSEIRHIVHQARAA